jgi:hypothetical protein
LSICQTMNEVVGANLCVSRPLESNGKEIGGGGGSIRGSSYCAHHKHYFPAAVLCSSLSQFLCRVSFCPQASDVDERHILVPGTISNSLKHSVSREADSRSGCQQIARRL